MAFSESLWTLKGVFDWLSDTLYSAKCTRSTQAEHRDKQLEKRLFPRMHILLANNFFKNGPNRTKSYLNFSKILCDVGAKRVLALCGHPAETNLRYPRSSRIYMPNPDGQWDFEM